jgi:hypothetical protein
VGDRALDNIDGANMSHVRRIFVSRKMGTESVQRVAGLVIEND